MVKRQSGFKYMPERPDADSFVKQKWGWRATEPGGKGETDPKLGPLLASAAAGTPRLSFHACRLSTSRLLSLSGLHPWLSAMQARGQSLRWTAGRAAAPSAPMPQMLLCGCRTCAGKALLS